MSEDRGRSQRKSSGLSRYYRENFGSLSPEEYRNLRISGFDDHVERDEIKNTLTQEFKKFAPFEIKVVRNPTEDERLAYVNFERQDCARTIRYKHIEKLRDSLGRDVVCDPAGILRDQEGKYIPDRFNRALQGEKRPTDRNRPSKEPSQWRLKQDDSDATRTLFVGNMPADVKEHEIRKIFDRYGRVEEVDIKNPVNTDAAYAFVMFQTIDQAIDAKNEEQDRPIRNGSSRMKIGYGKSQVSRRLWVGRLGDWCERSLLNKEFDRYGPIEHLDYEEGDDFAYVTFVDTNAAQDAHKGMKNFALGGRDHCIFVDYAKEYNNNGSQRESRKRRASRSPSNGRSRLRTPPQRTIRDFTDLDEENAYTWIGAMLLKKTQYLVKMYRIAGSERILQKYLRDEEDEPLLLMITQRLSLIGQDGLLDKLLSKTYKEMSAAIITPRKDDGSLAPLSRYLSGKNAAGVVTVPSGVLYLFPSSEMADLILEDIAPHIKLMKDECPYLLGVVTVRSHVDN